MRTRGGSLRGTAAENLTLDKHATARRSRRRSTRAFGDRRSENLVAEEVSIPTAGAAGDDKAGEGAHCCSLREHATGDVAAGDTNRASPSAVPKRQEKSCTVENQHVVARRSARCLSMSAAVASQASSVQRSTRSKSSAASSFAPTVLTNCDANVATTQVNTQANETEKDRVEGSTPPPSPPPPAVAAAPEDPVKQYPAPSAPGAHGPAPAPVDAEDNPPALAELTSAPVFKVCPITTTAPTRRASIPCHRSEKHPAALRRRPFSVGSGVLDSRSLLIIPPAFAAPEINPVIGSDGSIGDPGEAVPRGSLAELAVGATPLLQQLPSATGRPPAIITLVEDVGVASPLAVPAPAATSAVSTCSGVPEGCSRVLARDEEPTTPCSTGFALVDYDTSPSTAAGSPPAAAVLVNYEASPLRVSPAEVETPSSTTCAPLAAALVDYGMTPSVSRLRKEDSSSPSPRLDEEGFALDPDEPAPEDGGRVEGKARVTSDPAGSRGEALARGEEEEETADAPCLSTREAEGTVELSNQEPIAPKEIEAAGAEPVEAIAEDGVSGLSEESVAVAPEGTLVAAGVAGSAETPDDGEEAQAGEMAAAVASTETEAASNKRGDEPYASLNSPDIAPGGTEEVMADVAVAPVVPTEASNDAQSEAPLAVAMDLDIAAALKMVVAGVVARTAMSAEEDCGVRAEEPLPLVMGLDAPGTVEETIVDEVVMTSTVPTEPADDEQGGDPLGVAAESDAAETAVPEELVPEVAKKVPSTGKLDVDEATARRAVLGCEGPPASQGAVAGTDVASRSNGSSSSVEHARQDLSPPAVVQEVRAVRRSARRRSVAFPSAPCFETTLSSVNAVSADACGDNQGIQPVEETHPPRRPRRRRSVVPEKPRLVEAPAPTPAPALAPVPAPTPPVMDLDIAAALEMVVAGVVARTAAPAEEDCDAQAEELRASIMGLDAPGTVEEAIAVEVVTSTVPTEPADDEQGGDPLGVAAESDAAETAVTEELVPEVATEVPSTGKLDVDEATAVQRAVLGCEGPPASQGAVAGTDVASRSNGSSSSVEHARQDLSPPVVQEVRAVRRSARRRSVALAPCFEMTLSSVNAVSADACGDNQGIQPVEETHPPRRPRRRRSVVPEKPRLVEAPAPAPAPAPVPNPAPLVMDLHIADAPEEAVAGVVARTAVSAEEDCDAQAEELRASIMGLDAPGTVEEAIAVEVVTSTVPTEPADDEQGGDPLGVAAESDAAETAVPEELVPEVTEEVHVLSTWKLDVDEATAVQRAVLGCEGPPASQGAVAGTDVASRSNGSSSSVEHARQSVSPPPVVQEVRAVRRSARRRSVAFPSAPCFETTLNSVSADARGDIQGIQPIEDSRPPRRPRRRRSVAPEKPPLVGAPAPVSSPAPHVDATSSEYSSSPIGSGLCDMQFAFPVHEGRPPPRSGRRRSIAPKKILSAPASDATSTAATTPTAAVAAAAAAAAVPPFGEATSSAAAKEKSLSSTDAGPSDDDQSSLPSQEGSSQSRRPRQRRQPLAATPTEQQQIAAAVLPPVDVADTAASSEEQGTSSARGEAAAAAAAADAAADAAAAAAAAGAAAAGVQQDESLPEQQVALPRRRSTRRKSIRGSRARGSLLEESTAAPRVEAPVFLQEGSGGGGSGGAGGSGRALVVEAERGGTQATTDVAAEQGGTVMAGLLNKCLEAARAEVPQGDDILPLLRDLSDAWIDAEACALKNADDDTGDEMHRGSAVVGAGNAGPPRAVRLCTFNFSAVGMPLDTAAGSELQALEVVRCLEGVVTALHKIENFHRRCNFIVKTTGGSGDESNGNGNSNRLVVWKAFLREVRAAAAAAAANAIASGEGGGRGATAAPGGGGRDRQGRRPPAGMKEKEMVKAGLVLLGELEPLERSPEGLVKSPLRDRLATMLSSLIRFHLRIRLDAPPERLTRAPEALPSCGDPSYAEAKRRAEVLPPSHFSKVHTVVDVSETDATLGASFSKALFRLKGFSYEMAVEVLSAAEAFAAADQTRLAERDGGCPARVESAGRLLSATADVVDAVRARKFVLSLLELEGVEEAIVEAGGWGNVEMWASSLKKLKGCADIDEPLTLLSDVGAFKAWLRSEPTWGHATETAEGILRSLLELPALRGLVERARQRWMCPEAYQTLRQEILEAAHDRFRFPELKKKEAKAAAEGKVEAAVVEQSAGKGKPVKKATASTRKQKGKKKDKQEEKKTGGQRESTAAGKQRSTARSPSDVDGSSGTAEAPSPPSRTVVATDQPPAAGKCAAKSKRKRRSSIA